MTQRSDDLPDALIDCHQRLREVTGLAAALAERATASLDEVRQVASKLERYFTVALVLHEQDEEQSLFPRLVARAPALASTIAALRVDHEAHAAQVGALVALCQELKTWPERCNQLRGELGTAARAMAAHWAEHLTLEEAELFPAVRTALTPGDLAEIREEMRARRARLPR